ncbi:MAG: universal stress protein [Haloarculaceae archaeon]
MTDLLERVVVPLASPDDATATARSARPYLGDAERVVLVYVVEKAGGAPDKAGVEQREEYADEIFDAAEADLPDVPVERDVRYGTDVVEAIFDAAEDADATAVVVATRGGSRLVELLTGDVARGLVTENDRPVVVLPHGGGDGG